MRRHFAFAAHRAAPDSTRSHSALQRSNRLWSRSVRCRGCLELAIDGSCCNGSCNFVIASATAQVDDISVVRIVKDSKEISLAEAFAVASEKIARSSSHGGCGSRGLAFDERCDCSLYEIERLVARETNSA